MIGASELGLLRQRYAERASGWQRAHTFGIEIDQAQDAWNAGHVNAILSAGPIAIVGTNHGGVWLVSPPRPDAIPQTTDFEAVSLSFGWDQPDIQALCYGPDGKRHVYAGCGGGGGLYLIDSNPVAGGLEFVDSWPLPAPPAGDINALLADSELRRIIIGTANGLWWSSIPADPADTSYSWQNAPVPNGISGPRRRHVPFYTDATIVGLARGPQQTVLVAVKGVDSPGWLFYGIWSGQNL
jgi:hypothetical protein